MSLTSWAKHVPCLLLLPAATACTQELCESDLMGFTRAMREILFDETSGAAYVDTLAPILTVSITTLGGLPRMPISMVRRDCSSLSSVVLLLAVVGCSSGSNLVGG